MRLVRRTFIYFDYFVAFDDPGEYSRGSLPICTIALSVKDYGAKIHRFSCGQIKKRILWWIFCRTRVWFYVCIEYNMGLLYSFFLILIHGITFQYHRKLVHFKDVNFQGTEHFKWHSFTFFYWRKNITQLKNIINKAIKTTITISIYFNYNQPLIF